MLTSKQTIRMCREFVASAIRVGRMPFLERLNIRSDSHDWRAAILSNLAETPFRCGGCRFLCVEAALQGMKFADKQERERVFAMNGRDALREGRKITMSIADDETAYVYWDDERLVYGSIEHRLLIATIIGEKVRQNPKVQRALLATEGLFIYHDVGQEHPKTSLPEKFYIEILLAQRRLLWRLARIT